VGVGVGVGVKVGGQEGSGVGVDEKAFLFEKPGEIQRYEEGWKRDDGKEEWSDKRR
jgi:hypothetical protein